MSKAVVAAIFSIIVSGGMLTPRPACAQIRSEMKVFNDAFISPAFEATQKTSYQFVGAQLKTDDASQDNIQDLMSMDITGAVALGEPLLNYLNISEFYYAKEIAEAQTLTIGRRKMLWNELDTRWDLGVWEPVFKWNPLSPESQGLTGFFWDVKRPTFAITMFASPLFLPNQGPSFEIQDGEFIKSNPWFHLPPDEVHIFSETTKIEYRMNKPNESQVISQTSYGAKINFGDPKNLFFQLSQIYKPVNQLAVGYDGILDISIDRGIIDLQPQVVYHSLTGADLTYQAGAVKLGASVLRDRPNRDNPFDSQWTRPVFEDATLVTGFMDIETRYLDFRYQRLDITGGKVTEVGPLADPNRRPLMTRYPFRQANEFGIGGHLSFAKFRRLVGTISYTLSDQNDFSMVKCNARFKFSRFWNVYAEMQLINAGSLTADNQNDIAQYANNDRFMLGASYVF